MEPRGTMPDAELNTQSEIETDIETDIEIDEGIEPTDYLVLKFTFVPTQGNVGGALCLIYEGASGEIISQQLWVARPYIPKPLTVNRNWRAFVNMFDFLEPYYKPFVEKLSYLLEDLLPTKDRVALFEEAKKDEKRCLTSVTLNLRRGFERATLCFFDVDSDMELTTRSELEQAKILEPLTPVPVLEDTVPLESEDTTMQTVIKCRPVVDPIGGKPVSEIQPGDIVEVEIVDKGVGAGALVHQFLGKTGLTSMFPVEEIVFSEEKATIYLHISDEIKGIMSLGIDLKMKIKTKQIHFAVSIATLEDLVKDVLYFTLLGSIVILLLAILRILLM